MATSSGLSGVDKTRVKAAGEENQSLFKGVGNLLFLVVVRVIEFGNQGDDFTIMLRRFHGVGAVV